MPPGFACADCSATEGWGFESLKGDSRIVRAVGANTAESRFDRHAPQKVGDFVLSAWKG